MEQHEFSPIIAGNLFTRVPGRSASQGEVRRSGVFTNLIEVKVPARARFMRLYIVCT